MIASIKFKLNDHLYNRDPQETTLGQKILKNGILLLDEIGFEAFTFKKLAKEIGSAEKSVYRYFENKHMLLLFLTSWYWEWVHFLINTNIINLNEPIKKLEITLRNIVLASAENPMTEYVNENILHRVIINDGSKAYHTCAVDKENKEGLFFSYKSVVKKVSEIILEVNPEFPYAVSLASNFFEMANNQIYFAHHLPRMTNINDSENTEEELIKMLQFFAHKLLKP